MLAFERMFQFFYGSVFAVLFHRVFELVIEFVS